MKGKIDIWAISSNFDDLKEEVKRQNHNHQDFKVIYLKNPISHPDYQETLDKCKDISWFIAGSVNMSKPKHTIALTKVNDLWIIGYYHHGVPSWKKYDDKPNTFSNSLDIRLARTLINIAGENDQTKTMIDPCCGMGTVVLEGLALGYSIKGFDISRDISWKARCNLNHFGFDGMLIKKMILISIKDIIILLLLIFLIIFIHRLLIKNSVILLIVLENYVINLF